MDLLSEILQTVRLRGNLYFRTDLGAPWGIDVPGESQVARFHVVIRGGCWLLVAGDSEPIYLAEGDLAIVPHGAGHQMSDPRDTPCRPLMEVLTEQPVTSDGVLRHGGEAERTVLVCGYFSFDEDVPHPLLASLPRKLHLKGSDNRNFLWLDTVMRFISSEAGAGLPGSRAIAERLSEILFIQVIRLYAASAPQEISFLAALNDQQIARALKGLHGRLAHKWTLEEMARIAGSSRSAFVGRFTTLLGIPPAQYLTRVRMLRARLALESGKASLAEIAEDSGYNSEAAFSTAFKRHFGRSPGAYRRQRTRNESEAV